MWPNPQFPAYLGTFTKEIHFLCSEEYETEKVCNLYVLLHSDRKTVVCTPPLFFFAGGGRLNLQPNFRKGGAQLLEGGEIFQGRCTFHQKKFKIWNF